MKNTNSSPKKAKRGSNRKLTVGGSVFTDKDYSSIFKDKTQKNFVIALSLSPVIFASLFFWIAGLKILAVLITASVCFLGMLILLVLKVSDAL